MTKAQLLKAAFDKKAAKATAAFCIKLGKFIKANKISLKQLSADTGIHQPNLSIILRGGGNPECDTLMKIIDAAKIGVDFYML